MMPDTPLPLTIITPCFNEEAVIPHLAEVLNDFTQSHQDRLKLFFIFVDDGSQDRTWELLNHYFPASQQIQLLQHSNNQGIAGAIITGFAHTTTELVAVIDSDCTFHPAQLADMLPLMGPDTDVVTSSPLHAAGEMQNVPKWRQSMSYGAAWLYRRLLKQQLTSYTSCFRIYRTSWVRNMRLSQYGFCGVTEILVRLDMQGARFKEFPAVLGTREHGYSKINTLKTILEHLAMARKIIFAKWLGRPLVDRPLPGLPHEQ